MGGQVGSVVSVCLPAHPITLATIALWTGMTSLKRFSQLSKRQRELTPLPFAEYLVRLTHAKAALWVRSDTVYRRLKLDIWDTTRDANLYDGDGPIIAHPPCGPWGKLAHLSTEDRRHGIRAMELVHQYGGVVEQPAGSQLFKLHGRPGALILWVNQADYGHPSMKPTDLYLWACADIEGLLDGPFDTAADIRAYRESHQL